MVRMTAIMFGFTLDPIMEAYKVGRDALRERYLAYQSELDDHNSEVVAGRANDYFFDNETGQGHHVAEHMVWKLEKMNEALNRHAQAFAIMLHHAWEKHARSNFGWERYESPAALKAMAKGGWRIEHIELARLCLVVNCIKHDDGERLLKLHPEMFDESLVQPPHEHGGLRHLDDALVVRDADILAFDKALRRSAPRDAWNFIHDDDDERPLFGQSASKGES